MKILVCTTLFPNEAMPTHGIFVENRLSAFRKRHDCNVKVIAPVPWFPFQSETFGAYGAWARVPKSEHRNGVEIFHPRYFLPPKIGMNAAPDAVFRALYRQAQKLIDQGWDFDLIDAHYFYPDGVAAARLAKALNKPLVITARGTDINLIPTFEKPRQRILHASYQADAIITVAEALKTELVRLGAPHGKITTLRNGVDLDKFTPHDRTDARHALGLPDGPVIASVGHLIDRKGHDLVIEALRELPDATLVIAGDGEKRGELTALAQRCGCADRVKFLGRIDHDQLSSVYAAADVLVLASDREGWPNVLLEAMACGCPCVATNIWGSGEVIRAPQAGKLVDERTASSIAAAIKDLLASPPERSATRTYAEQHSWDETTDGMAAVFQRLIRQDKTAKTTTSSPIRIDSAQPKLMVTVDTEEAFDWSDFDTVNYQVCTPDDLTPFQIICRNLGVTPHYFLTYAMLQDPSSAAYFKALEDNKTASFGLHLHQWVTPPETEHISQYYSFQKNLPLGVHEEKLQNLAAKFQEIIGTPAKSHRAGRYGVAIDTYALLASLGIKYDFSPSAAFDFSAQGGPDFSAISNHPFRINNGHDDIAVIPVCGAKVIKRTRIVLDQEKNAPGLAASSQNRQASKHHPMRLSPEGACLSDLQALTRRLIKSKTPILTFTLHSTSLTKGTNAYSTSDENVSDLLETTQSYLHWFKESIGGELLSFRELEKLLK